jgi:hypothetical protein
VLQCGIVKRPIRDLTTRKRKHYQESRSVTSSITLLESRWCIATEQKRVRYISIPPSVVPYTSREEPVNQDLFRCLTRIRKIQRKRYTLTAPLFMLDTKIGGLDDRYDVCATCPTLNCHEHANQWSQHKRVMEQDRVALTYLTQLIPMLSWDDYFNGKEKRDLFNDGCNMHWMDLLEKRLFKIELET